VHAHVGQVGAQPADAGACDELTVVQLDALQIVTGDQMVQSGVGDERTIV